MGNYQLSNQGEIQYELTNKTFKMDSLLMMTYYMCVILTNSKEMFLSCGRCVGFLICLQLPYAFINVNDYSEDE